MPANRLGRLQQDVLHAFFRREARFFLTGGAALAGFYLGHRETNDLDLFAMSDILDDGVAALRETARELDSTLESIQTTPDLRRYLVRRGAEGVIVDLVRDYAEQMTREKPMIGDIRVDPPEEILANKLCALLARAEIRDLVDVWALERAGYRVEDALPAAARKDAGLTPGQLDWVLSQITIAEDAVPPGGVSAHELRSYLADLTRRLARLAFPGSSRTEPA